MIAGRARGSSVFGQAPPTSPLRQLLLLVACCGRIRSSFALVQLCCRTSALRASFLQQQHVAVHVPGATRDGFLGRTTTSPQVGGLYTRRTSATAAISPFGSRGGDARPLGASGRSAQSTTKAILAAALLLSSSSSVVVDGATRFGGWAGRRRGAHSMSPSMTVSAVASDAPAGGGASSVMGGVPAGDGAAGAKPKAPVVFVLGGPGSGKGTQCERLAKDYG